MIFKEKCRTTLDKISQFALRHLTSNSSFSRLLVAQGIAVARHGRSVEKIDTLADVEFSIFSQWGEDGIIDWLVHQNGEMPESFIEFGVADYRESNTRFLINSRNWRGLIIDGDAANIAFVQRDDISWRHDLTSKLAFITGENINELIEEAGFGGEIGILSVDIDGNDYWVWKAINCISPHIVIAEYNSVFGDLFPLTIPYNPNFVRTAAHYSNLYYGASITALSKLAMDKGYTLLGTNTAGNNAFFLRNDRASPFLSRIANPAPRPSRFREARDSTGRLTFARARARAALITDCIVVNVSTGRSAPLGSHQELYSERWSALLEGMQPPIVPKSGGD